MLSVKVKMKAAEGPRVQEACMFDIMALPEDTLKRVLPKVSIRIVSRLVASYPRAIGRTLLDVMSRTMSPGALEMLKDEMCSGRLPSLHQIREAEKEFLRTLHQENAFPTTIRS
jgi:hypothetical protein